MSLTFSQAVRNALLGGSESYATFLNGGTLVIYSGVEPTNADTALAGNTVLATLTFSATAFAAVVGGVPSSITANAIASANAVASNTATFFRTFTSAAGVVEQGSVTATGGGGDLQLNTTTIVTGGPVNISSLVRTL